jgi:hypothetical protein
MRPHFTVILMMLGVGMLLLLTRSCQEYNHRRQVRMGSEQSVDKLRQLARAVQYYYDDHGRLPAPAMYSKERTPLLSWRVAVLPYLGHAELYGKFRLDEDWNSPNNTHLLADMPSLYEYYGDHKARLPGKTYFQVIVGPGTAFESQARLTFSSFPDGTSETLLIVEAAEAVPWSAPEDLRFSPEGPLPKLGGHHPDFFLAALANLTVHRLDANTAPIALRAAITRNGGEKLRWRFPDLNTRHTTVEIEE